MFSTKALARAAAITGFISIGGITYMQSRIQHGIRTSDYYTESLKILRAHKGVAAFLGEPIRDREPNLGDNTNNFCTGKEAQFQVPVVGTVRSGTLYLWASREEFGIPWHVDRLELSVEDKPGKRILVYKGDEEN